jgi:transposase InsO family protein
MEALKRKTKEQNSPVILHTDQGSVYSSQAFTQAHHDYNILRSMSRVATPTDNPKIEALNGWIKEELRVDFHLAQSNDIRRLLNEYVKYFNHERPSYALNYQAPYSSELYGALHNVCLFFCLL